MAWQGNGREWSGVFFGEFPHLEAHVAAQGAQIVGQGRLSLDDIFVAHVGYRAEAEEVR